VGEVSTVAEKLREARALVAKGWTQDADARNAAGEDLEEVYHELGDTTPVCWCAGGAIHQVAGQSSYISVAKVFGSAIGVEFIPDWNDAPGRTQAEVLQAFDRAIELAESQA
jgi:hypothetical protein